MDIREQIEQVNTQLVDMRLNVVKHSDINPLDYICEVSADQYTRFMHEVGELIDTMEKLLAVYEAAKLADNFATRYPHLPTENVGAFIELSAQLRNALVAVQTTREHDAAFWKRRADQRQETINELKKNPPDPPADRG